MNLEEFHKSLKENPDYKAVSDAYDLGYSDAIKEVLREMPTYKTLTLQEGSRDSIAIQKILNRLMVRTWNDCIGQLINLLNKKI